MNHDMHGKNAPLDFHHILLTRFNARFSAKWTALCLDPVWLQHRFELFKKYCYPSVRSQTVTSFTWLVFFHEDTPVEYRKRVEALAEWPVMRPVYNDYLSRDVIMENIRSVTQGASQHIITSTLDNDDAICRAYIEETQKRFSNQDYQYVNWALGYVYHYGRFYCRRDLQSPFNSLISHVKRDKFVWDVWHNKILETGPVIQIDSEPGWLQVIHEKNISNRVRGIRVRRPALVGSFVFTEIASDIKDKRLEFLFDRHILCRLRVLRDVTIQIVKRFINLEGIAYAVRFRKRRTEAR